MSKISEDDFKPGTLIKIKNLQSRPELNGRSGVIDGKRKDNERFPVMCDGEKVISLKEECIEIIQQCPNEEHVFENGMLPIIWPHVKHVPTPTIEWLFDETLKTDKINVFDKNLGKSLAWKQFQDRLQKRMNWTDLQCLSLEMTNDAKAVKGNTKMLMFHEKTSKQRVNDWLEIGKWSGARKQWTMRGPIIFMAQFSKAQNERSSNAIKRKLYSTRYHPDDYRVGLKTERINYRSHKLKGIFSETSICPKSLRCIHCIKFQVQHKTDERELKKVAEQLNVSKREASSKLWEWE